MSQDLAAPAVLDRRLQRERRARLESEHIAEQTTRELYDTVQGLERSQLALAEAASLVGILQRVAVAANEAETFEEAAAIALDAVCDHTRWPIGHLYLVDEAGDPISTSLWRVDDLVRTASFKRATQETRLVRGQGLPGRVLVSAQPVWIPDVTRDPDFPRLAAADDIDVRSAFAIPILIGGEVSAVLEFFSREPSEPDVELLWVLTNVANQLGRVIERQAFRRRLEHQSLHDSLTGLPNRALLLDRLQHALDCSRRDGHTVAVLFLDLDRFKAVNDSLGHQAGDCVLVEVARRLNAILHPGDSLARLSGDEFVVLSDDDVEGSKAAGLASRSLAVLSTPFEVDGNQVHISASIGITLADSPSASPEGILGDADLAMYRAKDRGRGVSQRFDESLKAEVLTRLATERSLRRGIARGELVAAYQPVVDLRRGVLIGAEALVRWRHPERGLLPPKDFIGLAEESDLIERLGEWMLRQACQQLRVLRDQHPQLSLWMAVNLCVRELEQPQLAVGIDATLAEFGLPASALVLEITESAVMHDAQVVHRGLAALRELGVQLLIDDFGTGFSSLDRLRSMPVQGLKIDRSFVVDMDTTAGGTTLVAAIIAMAHSLGLHVTAEGVELPQQLETLRRLGCDNAQGYLLGHPGPASDIGDPNASDERMALFGSTQSGHGEDMYEELSRVIARVLAGGDEVDRTTRSLIAEIQRLVGHQLLWSHSRA